LVAIFSIAAALMAVAIVTTGSVGQASTIVAAVAVIFALLNRSR
jgi:hypothetical protein